MKVITLFKFLLQVLISVPILYWLQPTLFAGFSICVLVAVIVDAAFMLHSIKLQLEEMNDSNT